METSSLKGNLPQMRRFLAIGLTVLSLLFLFWPSMAAVNSEVRADYIKEETKKYQGDSDNGSYYTSNPFSKADARAMANAEWLATATTGRAEFSFLQVRNGLSAGATELALMEKYAKKQWEENYREWRSNYSEPYTVYNSNGERVAVSSYKEYVKVTRPTETKKLYSFINTYSVLVNILFFALLACGIVTLVLYAMGQTRITGIVFAALTVVADIVFIIMLSYIKKNDDIFGYSAFGNVTAPGASMFLLPIFTLAACILYQPSKKTKRVKPRRAPHPAPATGELFTDTTGYVPPVKTNENPFTESTGYMPPVKTDENPFTEAPRPEPRPVQNVPDDPFTEAPRPAAEGWTCPSCNTTNRIEARYCTVCGMQRSVPEQKAPACRYCGKTLKPGVKFCPYCGKQQP